ncbi:caspase, EACC1-associated type [Nocardia abscessus]|uniref:caspase, EACC1-associated type n=1 Tax=Nocardia abscessus TaxID=120957 RepID=UPI000319AE61|nr:caspase family protein [Nocardia abscessus]MCC3331016.1 caspase family protein [Nocardia abscessus]
MADNRATALGSAGSRALVVGTGRHGASSRLPDVVAVDNTVAELGRCLTERCGMCRVEVCVDPAGPREFLRALIEMSAQASDVFLFYYVGHGLIGPGGELYLATAATEDEGIGLAVDALAYSTVREALTECPARSIIVVLDCCFSGRAHGSFGTAVADAFELSYVRGSFLLSSASATEQALAPPGEPFTGFSGELIRFLDHGETSVGRFLTADDAYRHLARALPSRGLPAPHRRAGDRAGEIVLAVNPAAPATVVSRHGPLKPINRGGVSEPRCPYRGLDAFTAVDAGYFFGRDDMVAAVLQRLVDRQDEGPVAVIGRSGSGKSSLLQAGVLPAIHAGRLNIRGSRNWPQLVMRPGTDPVRALASRLTRLCGISEDEIAARVRADETGLADIVRAASNAGRLRGGRLVLVVDQFEELFVDGNEAQRHAFVRAICVAGRSADRTTVAPLMAILCIRADFYSYCTEYPDLVEVLRDAQVPVPPMNSEQLREVIEKPARAVGLTLEDGLIPRLLLDLRSGHDLTAESGGTLPLLSYALMMTWHHREGAALTLAGYQDSGGIWEAVSRQAEQTYEALAPDRRRAARHMLLKMVRLGEGTEDTRRRLALTELAAGSSTEQALVAREVLAAFVAARLVTVADGTAEITHEGLLRVWQRLRDWIAEDRAALVVDQQFGDAARAWDHADRDATQLYSGNRLARARERYAEESSRAALSSLERDFLDTSSEAARRRERRRRLQLAAAVLAVVLIVTGGAVAVQRTVRAAWEHRAALDSQAVRSSQELAAAADALRMSDPAAALRLSLTAYNSARTPQARSSLYRAYVTPYPTTVVRHAAPSLSVAHAADGRIVASSGHDHTVRLSDIGDPFHPKPTATLPTDSAVMLVFSPDSRLLAARSQRNLFLWDVRDPFHPEQLAAIPLVTSTVHVGDGDPAIHPAIAFSADGAVLATTGTEDGTVQLWDVRDPRRPALDAEISADTRAINDLAFRPDGLLAAAGAAGSDGGVVRLWDTRHRPTPIVVATLPVNSAFSLALSRSGQELASAGGLGDLHVWDLTDPAAPREIEFSYRNSRSNFMDIAYGPDGRGFLTTGSDGTATFWTRSKSDAGYSAQSSLRDPSGILAAEFSPDGRRVLTADGDGTIGLWSVPASSIPGTVQQGPDGTSAFNSDGTLLVTAQPDMRGAQLWQVDDLLRPRLVATLPDIDTSAAFIADGRILLTQVSDRKAVRLWNVSDSRNPSVGASVPTPHIPAARRQLLATVSVDDRLELRTVTDILHPVLHATVALDSPVEQTGAFEGLWFLEDGLLGVSYENELHLWDVRDPAHPVRRGTIASANPTYGYFPSRHLLMADPTYVPDVTYLWDLTDPDHPVSITEKPSGRLNWINASTATVDEIGDGFVVGIDNSSKLIKVWDLTDPAAPATVGNTAPGSSPRNLTASPKRNVLVGTGSGGGAQIWKISGSERPELEDLITRLPSGSQIVFRPDGNALATLLPSDTGNLGPFYPAPIHRSIIWPLDTESLYRQLCTDIDDVEVTDDWKNYLPRRFHRPACT